MACLQVNEDLSRCCKLIEEKFGSGPGNTWSTSDFERLGEQISDKTGVSLSVTTLKRIWNRVKYNSSPTHTTLNALAVFLDYDNWWDFQSPDREKPAPEPVPLVTNQQAPEYIPVSSTPGRPRSGKKRRLLSFIYISGIVIILAGIFVFSRSHSSSPSLIPENFSFTSKPVTKGIPNSVVFHYDASKAAGLPVSIQQSWDSSRRQQVPANSHEHSSIYYYPGYYRAKLVVNSQIVKEHDLIIPSDGWTVAIINEPVPIYFKPEEVTRNGLLNIPLSLLEQQNIPMRPNPPVVFYGNVLRSTGLMSDNFIFSTSVRSDFSSGAAACQYIMINILCKNNSVFIPLCAKGCVGNLRLGLGRKTITSAEADLSAFGGDLNNWTDLRCEVRNNHVTIFINGKKAYEASMEADAAEVLGINYRIQGTGSVDYARLSHLNGQPVLEDNFDPIK